MHIKNQFSLTAKAEDLVGNKSCGQVLDLDGGRHVCVRRFVRSRSLERERGEDHLDRRYLASGPERRTASNSHANLKQVFERNSL